MPGSLIHEEHNDIPEVVRHSLIPLVTHIYYLDQAIKAIDSDIVVQAKADPLSNRLMTIPGIGLVTATALAAKVDDPAYLLGPREFAAFLGLVPRQHSLGWSRANTHREARPSLGRLPRWATAISERCSWSVRTLCSIMQNIMIPYVTVPESR